MISEQVAIFWDYENCEIGTNAAGYDCVNQIRRVAHVFGPINLFKAYSEVNEPSERSLQRRSELQSSGVSLTDCPHNGRKDVADKMMLVDMMAYAIDNPAPATVILISGDRDFVYAVSVLRHRRYRVVAIVPPAAHISLKSQASIALNWNGGLLGPSAVKMCSTLLASERFDNGEPSVFSPRRNSEATFPTPTPTPTPSSSRTHRRTTSESVLIAAVERTPSPLISQVRVPDTVAESNLPESAPSHPPPSTNTPLASADSLPVPTPGPETPEATGSNPIPENVSEERRPQAEIASDRPKMVGLESLAAAAFARVGSLKLWASGKSMVDDAKSTFLSSPTSETLSADQIVETPIAAESASAEMSSLPSVSTTIPVKPTTPSVDYDSEDLGFVAVGAGSSSPSSSEVSDLFASAPLSQSGSKTSSPEIDSPSNGPFETALPASPPSEMTPVHDLIEGASTSELLPPGIAFTNVTPVGVAFGNFESSTFDAQSSIPTTLDSRIVSSLSPEPATKPPLPKSAFKVLIKQLKELRAEGVNKPTRSILGSAIMAQNSLLYTQLGVVGFKEYVNLAEDAGIVTTGGTGNDAWVSLRLFTAPSGPTLSATAAPFITFQPATGNSGVNPFLNYSFGHPTMPQASSSMLFTLPPLASSSNSATKLKLTRFKPLHLALRKMRDIGCPKPTRSQVHSILVAQNARIFEQVGVSDHTDYLHLSESAGMVTLGGAGRDAWVTLRPGWVSYDVLIEFKPLVERLDELRAQGQKKARINSDFDVRTLNKDVYQKVGVNKLREYVELAAEKGLVRLGGSGNDAWVSLTDFWVDRMQYLR